MNKSEIKRILIEQTEPMDTAVERKLAYLRSDDFAGDTEQLLQSDDSLLNAFSIKINKPNVLKYEQPSIRELHQNTLSKPEPKYVTQGPTEETIQEHKQNLAARIAALRGISSPGDYLRRK